MKINPNHDSALFDFSLSVELFEFIFMCGHININK